MKQRLDFSDMEGLQLGLQLWSAFLQSQAKQSLKQQLDFSDKKGLELWRDLLKFQAVKQLKQRLDFSDIQGLQLSPHFFKFKPNSH